MAESTLGQRIRSAREDKGLIQKDLADATGKTVQSVSGWERDESKPSVDALPALGALLEVDLLWLLTGLGLRERRGDDTLAVSLGTPVGGRSVPRLSMSNASQDFEKAIEIATEFSVSHFSKDPQAFELIIEDEANAPKLMPGFKVVVSPNAVPIPGKLVFASLGESHEPALRLLKRARDPRTSEIVQTLHPLNEAWPDHVVDPSVDRIIGPVSEISEKH